MLPRVKTIYTQIFSHFEGHYFFLLLATFLAFRPIVGRPEAYVKIMPLGALTPQLRLRWTELSWSVGAECGKKTKGHFSDEVFSPAKLFTLFDSFFYPL